MFVELDRLDFAIWFSCWFALLEFADWWALVEYFGLGCYTIMIAG